MSWECRFLRETRCEKRNRDCDPGARGCVLEGRFCFPFKEESKPKKSHRD